MYVHSAEVELVQLMEDSNKYMAGRGYRRGEETGKKSPLTHLQLDVDLSPVGGEVR